MNIEIIYSKWLFFLFLKIPKKTKRDHNNVYFGTKNSEVYILKNDELLPKKIENYNVKKFFASSIDRGGNISFSVSSNTKGAYVLKYHELIVDSINKIDSVVNCFKIDNNDNVYFGTNNGIYVIKNRLALNSTIKTVNLEEIKNNNVETILNTLNYLNRENNYFLNLNKIKVINKTPTSATIVATKGKYRGEVNITYKIKNKDEINNIDLNDLVKKAVYFDFIDRNFYSFAKIKEIKEINTDNLSFGNVEITRDSQLLHKTNFKEVCFKKRERINTSSIKKTVKISKCDYDTKSKLGFQITTGLTKTKQENKGNGWNINPDDEMKLNDFVNLNNKNSKIINVLSNEFDLSNTNKQEQEMILSIFKEPADEIELAPYEKALIKYSVGEIHLENTLNLQQKISGTITAKIIDDNNEEQIVTLSIKEAMQILQKYSLLPSEITINEDNSITFNGKAKISLTQEAEPKLIMNTSIV